MAQGEKPCSKCKKVLAFDQDLLVSEFHARERTSNGTITRWQSRCKRCQKVANDKYRRETLGQKPAPPPMSEEERLERKRERNRRWAANLSPQQIQARRDYSKFRYRMARGEHNVNPGVNSKPVDLDQAFSDLNRRVDSTLYVEWLNRFIATCIKAGGDRMVASRILEMDESRMRFLARGGQAKVTVALIDRSLTRAGGDTQLWELLPEQEEPQSTSKDRPG